MFIAPTHQHPLKLRRSAMAHAACLGLGETSGSRSGGEHPAPPELGLLFERLAINIALLRSWPRHDDFHRHQRRRHALALLPRRGWESGNPFSTQSKDAEADMEKPPAVESGLPTGTPRADFGCACQDFAVGLRQEKSDCAGPRAAADKRVNVPAEGVGR
jgi:hypothetical protein